MRLQTKLHSNWLACCRDCSAQAMVGWQLLAFVLTVTNAHAIRRLKFISVLHFSGGSDTTKFVIAFLYNEFFCFMCWRTPIHTALLSAFLTLSSLADPTNQSADLPCEPKRSLNAVVQWHVCVCKYKCRWVSFLITTRTRRILATWLPSAMTLLPRQVSKRF